MQGVRKALLPPETPGKNHSLWLQAFRGLWCITLVSDLTFVVCPRFWLLGLGPTQIIPDAFCQLETVNLITSSKTLFPGVRTWIYLLGGHYPVPYHRPLTRMLNVKHLAQCLAHRELNRWCFHLRPPPPSRWHTGVGDFMLRVCTCTHIRVCLCVHICMHIHKHINTYSFTKPETSSVTVTLWVP